MALTAYKPEPEKPMKNDEQGKRQTVVLRDRVLFLDFVRIKW